MRRAVTALVVASLYPAALLLAQVPGRNVNMVSGTTWPDGDPYLQRQNEPSVAASTRNPIHLLAGANDYRTVDLPGLPDGGETGDAWLGVFKSFDGGQRWSSTLIPGYPQDPSHAAPLWGYQAAADPVVRAGTNGLFYFAGLAFNRGDNGASAVFVSRFIDNNNRENGDPMPYLGTTIVASDPGITGRFLDKPWIAVDVPRGTVQTCTIATPGANALPAVQHVPAGAAYIVYSAFTGSGATLESNILFSYSVDCGAHWSAPVRLNAADHSINQGASIAINPGTGDVYVAWRRFTKPGAAQTDAIMVARSVSFGKKFSAAKSAHNLPRGKALGTLIEQILEHRKPKDAVDVEDLSQFDQKGSASLLSFRTNAYPAMTFDDQGRLYVAWTERGYGSVNPDPVNGDARVVIATTKNGADWTAPAAVADSSLPGHQLMPSLAFAGGKLLLVYYDLREDVSGIYGKFVDDASNIQVHALRHTMDIRASLGTPGPSPVFLPSVKVSSYLFGNRQGLTAGLRQMQYNPPNLPMFARGTMPFMGDYIDLTPAPAFVPAGKGKWIFNTSSKDVPVFHAVWTDNRDVRQPANGDWVNYTPPVVVQTPDGKSVFDPTQQQPTCNGGRTGSRNQNIYTARITGGLLAGSPGNTKPLSTDLQRGFVVFAQNTTNSTRSFRLTILNQPIDGRASFEQFPLPPYTASSPAPVTTLDVTTPPYSMAVRTVYVTSSDPHALVTVTVAEIAAVGGAVVTNGLDASVLLNPDIENPDIENPDIENLDPANPDIENAEIMNPDIENPDIENPDIENPDIENPDIENPDIENITVANPDIENPDIENPDIENPDIENPDIENPDIENAPISDVSWTVTNTGNTTSGFNVALFLNSATVPSGIKVQLILHKTYKTPTTVGCELKTEEHNVLVANIPNPTFVTPADPGLPDSNDPTAQNATLWLAPGEKAKITLRVRDNDSSNNVIVNGHSIDPAFAPGNVTPAIIPQPVGTTEALGGQTTSDLITPDQSTLFFIVQPSTVPIYQTMPVSVQVRDKTGAVVPGASVTLTLNPTAVPGAALIGGGTATTNVEGVAFFPAVRVSEIGAGYTLSASANKPGLTLAPATSLPFAVTNPVVTNTADSGPGSLRFAMDSANTHAGPDTITFAIPGTGPFTIAPQTPLPQITDPVVIDARTQPGFVGTPVVEIDGALLTGPTSGLYIAAGGSTVRGLAVNRVPGQAIRLQGGTGNLIAGNYIGVDVTGAIARGSNGPGIYVAGSSNNTIGGSSAADRNVISGNGSGVDIVGPASGNTIAGNYVGTSANGLSAIGNVNQGISVEGGSGGGLTASTTVIGNLVSGNGLAGILVDPNGGSTQGTQIVNNTVGLSAAGSPLGNGGSAGVRVTGDGNAVVGSPGHGNVISSNTGAGLIIDGTPSAPITIKGNYIGTDPSGLLARGNAGPGVVIQAPNVLVGWGTGDPASALNLISANGADGIQVIGAAATNVTIAGNYIGTDATGNAALPTDLVADATWGNYQGIYVNGAQGVLIGGPGPEQRNVLSGNAINGVMLQGTATSSNTIQNNFIGTNKDGLAPIGNGFDGVGLLGAASNTVTGNVISSNLQRGVYVSGSSNHIVGNMIGMTVGGSPSLGNTFAGILLQNDADGTPTNNVIGETLPNTITGSGHGGVVVIGAGSVGNRILSNSIYNTGLAIDLGGDGITTNDASDADTGPNDLQNYPAIAGAAANVSAGKTYITFSLNTQPGTYRVQFFTSPSCGGGNAQTLLAETDVTVSPAGAYTATFEAPVTAVGNVITATATDSAGNTSEISACTTVTSTTAFYWSPASGGNGHFYQYVTTPLTWDGANGAANSATLNGMPGHLATIGDANENAFVQSLYTKMGLGDMRAWIGLYDSTGSFNWTWVTGEPFGYFNWDTSHSEPNNMGSERWVEFYAAGVWNNNTDSNPFIKGYVIEYQLP